MTQHTDQWLHDQFQAQAQTIEPPADLHGRSVERAYTAKTRRRRIQGTLAVGVAAAVTGAIVIVTGSLSPATQPTPADLTPAPTSWTFDLYFTTGGGRAVDPTAKNPGGRWKLTSETVTVPNSGDQPLDIVNALVAHAPTVEAINGFNFSSNGQLPIAEVNSVTVTPKVITVDLDREVWDPYPTISCICPPGDAVMQQLVWTLDSALESTLPVLLTINSEPAGGIWGYRLDGPVYLEQEGSSIDRERPGEVTTRAKALLGNRFVDLAVGPGQASYIIGVLNLQDDEIDDMTARLERQVPLYFENRRVAASDVEELRQVIEQAFATDRQGVRAIGSDLQQGQVLVGVASDRIPTMAEVVADLLPGPQEITRTGDGSALVCSSGGDPTRPCVIVKAVGLGELTD